MDRKERAKQFMPFDALKGLSDALRLKEYENESVLKGELSEEKAKEISSLLFNLPKCNKCEVLYFSEGHYKSIEGKLVLKLEENCIVCDKQKILLDDVFDVKLV